MSSEQISQAAPIVNSSPQKPKSRLMQITGIVLVVLVAIGLFNLVFGDKSAGKAEQYVKQVVTEQFEGAEKVDIFTKVVAKNESNQVYAVDTTIRVKIKEQENTAKSFILVYTGEDGPYLMGDYGYEDSNRKDVLEVVYAAVSRG